MLFPHGPHSNQGDKQDNRGQKHIEISAVKKNKHGSINPG